MNSTADLLDVLRRFLLLDAAQLAALTGPLQDKSAEPRAIVQQLLQRGWLTAYQADLLTAIQGYLFTFCQESRT